MSEGQIPVNLGDLPIDGTPLDDSQVYNGILRKVTISSKTDKNGNTFCGVQLEVADGDFEGRTVMGNYLPLPRVVLPDTSKAERIKAQDASVAFARFCRAFGIKGKMPSVSLVDRDSVQTWHDWVAQFYGNVGKFTVRNQEFPENSGRLRSGVNDFVF